MHPLAEVQPYPRVIAVDLDHTLIKSDTLHEQLVRFVFQKPHLLPQLVSALLQGKVAFKAFCADTIVLDPENLHACADILAYLREEKERGSYVVLCTAADQRVAQVVADHLGIFDEVIGTVDAGNLKGETKAETLAKRFPGGFIYAGDHAADLAVWMKAQGIILVGASASVARRARALGKPVLAEFRPRSQAPSRLRVWARALRVHHWSKNVLMLVPLILAHKWDDSGLILRTLFGFVLLLLMTSSTYLINDLADLDADRGHPTKRRRPIASGSLPLMHAMVFPVVVIPLVLIAAVLLSPAFAVALATYLAVTLGYSFGLKRIPLLDTFIIGVLFTLRLVMGVALLGGTMPIWLITFSMFFFFSLATAKRYAEIVQVRATAGGSLKARGYEVDDWPIALAFGVGAGLGSLVILVLYMVDEAFRVVGYSRPEYLWGVTLLVAVWIGRIWLLTHRGKMHDDPVSFALTDGPSRGIAVLIALLFFIAL